MAAHVIVEQALGTVNQNRDIPECFRRHGDINAEQAACWVRMIGFRNILIHEYLDVDRGIVHVR